MPTPLLFLLLTATLAASLWIPFIVGVTRTPRVAGSPDPFVVPPNPLQMRPWVARAYRAHQNLLEQFVPFAAIVLVGELAQVRSSWLGYLAGSFLFIRILHAVGMISGAARAPLRPLLFTAGYLVVVAYAAVVALA